MKKDNELVIEGLAAESEIKIVTPDGTHIRTLSTYSRRAVWDGRDDMNNTVKSGVYLVVVNSNALNEGSTQKIAVIND